MKPFEELTPRQQSLRQTVARTLIYGALAFGILCGMIRVVEWQEEANASAQRIEDTMMNYYQETKNQPDTVGMASYMKQRLTPGDYAIWLQAGEQ